MNDAAIATRSRRAFLLLLPVVLLACSPTAPREPESGRIADLQAARDIITYNQASGAMGPGRAQGAISRWDTPVRFVFDASVPPADRARYTEALDYWRREVGMAYTVVSGNTLPRVLLRTGPMPPPTGGLAAIDEFRPDNKAWSGYTIVRPEAGSRCESEGWMCHRIYRHELGHIYGFFEHGDSGLMGRLSGTEELTDRERRMMQALYTLPHGARVEYDGTWRVVLQ
jgi:hypothetical protein